ncbi:Acidic phosphoprotein precursor PCEMA1, putative, partial [Plasmodium chabaudi adami]
MKVISLSLISSIIFSIVLAKNSSDSGSKTGCFGFCRKKPKKPHKTTTDELVKVKGKGPYEEDYEEDYEDMIKDIFMPLKNNHQHSQNNSHKQDEAPPPVSKGPKKQKFTEKRQLRTINENKEICQKPKDLLRTDPEKDTKTESKTESKAESKMESKTESKTESKAESKTESKTKSKTESKTKSKTNIRKTGKIYHIFGFCRKKPKKPHKTTTDELVKVKGKGPYEEDYEEDYEDMIKDIFMPLKNNHQHSQNNSHKQDEAPPPVSKGPKKQKFTEKRQLRTINENKEICQKPKDLLRTDPEKDTKTESKTESKAESK